MPGLEHIDPRKIWKNYVIALVILLVLISVSHFSEMFAGGDSARNASLINTAGRQRSLSQRILYFATAYQHTGYTDADLRKGLETAMIEFEEAHLHLVDIAEHPRLIDMYFSETEQTQLDHESRRFLKDAHIILDGSHADRDAALVDMQKFAPNELVTKLNTAAHIYEDIALEDAERARFVSDAGYVLALGALAFIAVFIFRPTHQTIILAFSQLEESKDALIARERDAFAALEEAEEAWSEAEAARVSIEAAHSQSSARMIDACYELATPINALRLALSDAKSGHNTDQRKQALESAIQFADISEQMRAHLIPDELDIHQSDNTKEDPFKVSTLCQRAVSSVTADDPEKPGVILSLPQEKTPILIGDSMALYRTLCHFLRDARGLEGSSEIRLAVETQTDEEKTEVKISLTQKLDAREGQPVLGHKVVDKMLSPLESRAVIVNELVGKLDGVATVSWSDETREVDLVFKAMPQYVSRLDRNIGRSHAFRNS